MKHRYGVVAYGRRDHYQIPLALHEASALTRVFTDFYAPHWLIALAAHLDGSLADRLRRRHHPNLSAGYFSSDWPISQLISRYLGWRGRTLAERYAALDKFLSRRAARFVARYPDIGLVCYSYYWRTLAQAKAEGRWSGPAVVFQVHPTPSHIKRVLAADRKITGLSYSPEPEEINPTQADHEYLFSLRYADGVVAASSFTASGLTEDGVPPSKVRVVPYGSDTWQETSHPVDSERRWERQRPLKLLWVGQLAYRKGAHHLFTALRHFSAEQVQLSLVTQSAMPRELAALMPSNVTVCSDVTDQERQLMYRTHHLFVLPSLIEGFGLVYLEALAEGLPILATTNSGAPDIVEPGVEGFVVSPGSSEAIADVIDACLRDSTLLPRMSAAARATAACWTWARFRAGILSSLAYFEQQR
ncbi:MAG: glycosyltransferase family 4 protein [Anaerolineae bacterium]|nr:glycosyltransferase family 4 protein [Anaerolineae bacterium]